jgi:hypothetical protein
VIHGIGAATHLQSGVLLAVVLATIAAVSTTIAWRASVLGAPKPPAARAA